MEIHQPATLAERVVAAWILLASTARGVRAVQNPWPRLMPSRDQARTQLSCRTRAPSQDLAAVRADDRHNGQAQRGVPAAMTGFTARLRSLRNGRDGGQRLLLGGAHRACAARTAHHAAEVFVVTGLETYRTVVPVASARLAISA